MKRENIEDARLYPAGDFGSREISFTLPLFLSR